MASRLGRAGRRGQAEACYTGASDGAAFATRFEVLLAHPLSDSPAARRRLLLRLSLTCAAGPSADRQRRPLAGSLLPRGHRARRRVAHGGLPSAPDRFRPGRIGPLAGVARVAGRSAVGPGSRWLLEFDPDGLALGALHVVRAHRPGLVLVRLGDPAPRDRLPRDLPLPAPRCAALSPAAAAVHHD